MENREEKLKAARRLLEAHADDVAWLEARDAVLAFAGPSTSAGIRALSFALEALDETEAELERFKMDAAATREMLAEIDSITNPTEF
jgi:hypothetical protein